jgi:hypothetical protein
MLGRLQILKHEQWCYVSRYMLRIIFGQGGATGPVTTKQLADVAGCFGILRDGKCLLSPPLSGASARPQYGFRGGSHLTYLHVHGRMDVAPIYCLGT